MLSAHLPSGVVLDTHSLSLLSKEQSVTAAKESKFIFSCHLLLVQQICSENMKPGDAGPGQLCEWGTRDLLRKHA